MKTISDINIYTSEGIKVGKYFDCQSLHDNLKNIAKFSCKIFDEKWKEIFHTHISMFGEDYLVWGSTEDINESAYLWAATKLSISITGEYVVPENTAPPIIKPL
jgi:hypothetical protein